MFNAESVDWNSVKLLPYHASDLHSKITCAVKAAKQHDVIEFEPNDVWARVKIEVTGESCLTRHKIDTAASQIRDYLQKFDTVDHDTDKAEAETDMIDAESISKLENYRKVGI